MIFLGDYIDRGPDSKGVLDLMLHLQQDNPRNVFLMGNHEDNFLTYIQACLTDEGPVTGSLSRFLLAVALLLS